MIHSLSKIDNLSPAGIFLATPQTEAKTLQGGAYGLPKKVLEEFRQSAIPDALTLANIDYVEGQTAIEILTEDRAASLQKNTNYVTAPVSRLLRNYEPIADGGWLAYGQTIEGGEGLTAYMKPNVPRVDFERKRQIKYETPAGAAATPILPIVTVQCAMTIATKHRAKQAYIDWIIEKHLPAEITTIAKAKKELWAEAFITTNANQADPTFWQFAQTRNIPIAITEGLKKALCLIAHGEPAIALRGFTCWHPQGTKTQLHAVLNRLATTDRKITFFFDAEADIQKVKDINRESRQFASVLQKRGCIIRVAVWEPEKGKGIDDAIAAHPGLLDVVMGQTLTIGQFTKDQYSARLLKEINKLNSLAVKPDRATQGGYLPKIELAPANIKQNIVAIAANTGSGKTTRIGEDLVNPWIKAGGFAIALSPLVSTGKQTAYTFGLPHLNDFARFDEHTGKYMLDLAKAREAAIAAGGIALCVNSLEKITPDWYQNEDKSEKPLMIVLDEVNQELDFIIGGGNLGRKQSKVYALFGDLLRKAGETGTIIAAESQIYDRTIDTLKAIAMPNRIRLFTHWRNDDPWQVTIGGGVISGFIPLLGQPLGADGKPIERFLYLATSQHHAQIIEQFYRTRYPEKTIIRYDSKTNREGEFEAFQKTPDEWCKGNNPHILIMSPSGKTGLSITWPGFDAVFGALTCLDGSSHEQFIARLRTNVPRYLFVNNGGVDADEFLMNPAKILKVRQANRAAFLKMHKVEVPEALDEFDRLLFTAAEAHWAASTAVQGAQKSIPEFYLRNRLEALGHNIEQKQWAEDEAIAAELNAAKHKVWRDEARLGAGLKPYDTVEDAESILEGECSYQNELRAKKTLLADRYPGLDFNNEEIYYWAVVEQWGAMEKGVKRQVQAEFTSILRQQEKGAIDWLMSDPLTLSHTLPKAYIQAALREAIGLTAIQTDELFTKIFTNESPELIKLQEQAAHFADNCRQFLNLQFGEEYRDSGGKRRNTPIDVFSRLIGQYGLELRSISRKGKRGQRSQQYQVFVKVAYQKGESRAATAELMDKRRAAAYKVRTQLEHSLRETYLCAQICQEAQAEADQARALEAMENPKPEKIVGSGFECTIEYSQPPDPAVQKVAEQFKIGEWVHCVTTPKRSGQVSEVRGTDKGVEVVVIYPARKAGGKSRIATYWPNQICRSLLVRNVFLGKTETIA